MFGWVGAHHGESKGNKLVCESDINSHPGTKQPDRSARADGSAPLLVLVPPALSTLETPQSACSVSPSWKAPCVLLLLLLHVGDGRTPTKEKHPRPNHIFASLITTGPMNVGCGVIDFCALGLEATTRLSPLWSALGCDRNPTAISPTNTLGIRRICSDRTAAIAKCQRGMILASFSLPFLSDPRKILCLSERILSPRGHMFAGYIRLHHIKMKIKQKIK